MIHPSTTLQLISPDKGIGVVATEFIPKGTIIWVLDNLDRVFSPEDVEKANALLRNYLDRYAYVDTNGNTVLCWDHARYVHHSYKANSLRTPYDFELTVRDILPGEEISCDYGYLNVRRPIRFKHEIHPTRKLVYPDDPLRYHTEWDAQLGNAFKSVNIVDQPLWGLINQNYLQKVRQVALGKEKMDSTVNLYFDANTKILAA